MKTIALYNIKGGVGKTACAVNLAYLGALNGYRTLLWDMDPQGAASFYFRIKPKIKGGAERLVKPKGGLLDHIKGTDYAMLDLLPADFSSRNLDLLLEERKKPTRRIAKLLEPLGDEYDLVFIDCAPSISLVSENVFRAADMLLIPTIPTTLSLRTLKQIFDYFRDEQLPAEHLRPFFSMVDSRRQMHRMITGRPPKKLALFLQSHIPYLSEIERMGLERKPACIAPASRAGKAYTALWQEVSRIIL
jgi:chromosome partitioning protein